ncbi:MAG: hypothetical protein E6I96_15095 [Chloroflexi bacterium]|nr:MAG: hypothetical protein E6I96_15095 [Chloroflexota bacterium]
MERRSVLISSSVAFVIVLVADVVYVGLINAQGPSAQPYIPRFVAGYLAVMAALIAVAMLPRQEIETIRVPLRAAAAAGLLVMGFLAAFTIGLPLVSAGILVTVALNRTVRTARSRPARLGGLLAAALAVALLLAGFELTQRLIDCPATGQTAGGGSGLVTGPYQWECVNGRPIFHSV